MALACTLPTSASETVNYPVAHYYRDPRNPFEQDFREILLPSKTLRVKQKWRESAGVGSAVWDCGFVLAHYLDRYVRSRFNKKRVVELGAGVGLVSMVAGLHGALVTATDSDATVLDLARENFAQNLEFPEHIRTQRFLWGDNVTEAGLVPAFDFLLAADVCYRKDSFPPLVKSLEDLTDGSSEVIMCFRIRYPEQMVIFDMLRVSFEIVRTVPASKFHSDFRHQDLGMHLLHLKRSSCSAGTQL